MTWSFRREFKAMCRKKKGTWRQEREVKSRLGFAGERGNARRISTEGTVGFVPVKFPRREGYWHLR